MTAIALHTEFARQMLIGDRGEGQIASAFDAVPASHVQSGKRCCKPMLAPRCCRSRPWRVVAVKSAIWISHLNHRAIAPPVTSRRCSTPNKETCFE